MQYVAGTAALFALGTYLGRNLHGPIGIISFIAGFGALIATQFTIRRSLGASVGRLRILPGAGGSWALVALLQIFSRPNE